MHFFLMSEGSLNPKIRFLGQKVYPAACSHTDTQTDIVNTEDPFQGSRNFPFNLSSSTGPTLDISRNAPQYTVPTINIDSVKLP